MILYPQIPHAVAAHLVEERRRLSIAEASQIAALDHPDAFFTATGGTRASRDNLSVLRDTVVSIARDHGFPNPGGEQAFDTPAAAAMHSTMGLAPAEAAKSGMWEFLCSVLLCDVVRWRFGGDSAASPPDRFLAGRRNTFQRLWWRGFVFYEQKAEQPYQLLDELGEDELVQIMERPFLAGTRNLSRTVARELVAASLRHPGVTRRRLIREGQKRIRRIAAFASFESLDEVALPGFVSSIFDEVAGAE